MSEESVRDAFRRWGYLQAQLDYLGRIPDFAHEELQTAMDGPTAERYREIYCSTIGVEFMHIP
ncbi:MAG: hypothetical protein KDD44_09510 [Bdellovibrionales bacterium]|nr:hypothetical protein [Bdellovibrionales bacterium]